ncbi:hypothetical protein VTL71DRAFT_8489 [Oculimacula yallundae]|uniref:Uncharacterized protein n=1 Tax=Oculimacula yallundae TaxID=86028 RepID=A0ABR4CXR2_9HELO
MVFNTIDHGLLEMDQQRFDFSLRFEQLFFSIIPSALFIVTSLWRIHFQMRRAAIVNAPVFQYIKQGAIMSYITLELSLLILTAIVPLGPNSIFMASSTSRLVAGILMIILSTIDHCRSARPSIVLSSYLFLTIVFDVAQIRTLFLLSFSDLERRYSVIFTISVAFKVGILFLEAQSKSKWIVWDEKVHSPEETSNIFSLGVFFWLNRMFLRGYTEILTVDNLYPLDQSLRSTTLHDKFSRNMDYSKMKGDKYGLLKVLVRTLATHLLLPIPGRLAQLGFTFCQPFFIEKLLEYLSQPAASANAGYGLIGASILIYGGIAISTALCMYPHHRMRAMARSILVTEVFAKATKARMGVEDHNAALTLMSTDIERIKLGFRMIHNVWAGFIQVALAGWMLHSRLGLVFLVPIGLVTVCFAFLGVLISFTGDSQRSWMAGVQKRVGLTATVISCMKNLKISGLSSTVGDFVQNLRVEELAAGARFRKIAILAALFGFAPMLISPPLTLAFTGTTLDTTKVFTSLSFLMLLANPLSQIFQSVPEIVSGIACIGRIQAFLESESRDDFRQVLVAQQRVSNPTKANTHSVCEPITDHSILAVSIEEGNFGWEAEKFALQNVNIQIAKSSLTMVVGPVGSGKTTLCKAVLGEVPYSEGNVCLKEPFSRIGFCDQTPFLWKGTIKENIIGFSSFDVIRYAEIIEATSLSYDFALLPQGDDTNVGSDGISLSGGQKQRVSLARALYLQSDLFLLDDIFSGLDANTEGQVFRQVFGKEGLLNKWGSTVIMCTHSVQHLPAADHIIALEGGRVLEQGTLDTLLAQPGYVQSLGLKNTSDHSNVSTTSIHQVPLSDDPMPLLAIVNRDNDELRRVGDNTVYKHYFRSMGWLLAACCLFLSSLWGFFTNFPTIWLKFWTDDIATGNPIHSHAYYVGIYAVLQICAMVSLFFLGVCLFIVSVKRAGANLHEDILRTLLHAPLGFFSTTDTGTITNLFSQDLNLIDTELPDAVLNTLFCLSQAVGQAAVMLTSSAYLGISYPFLAAILYLIARFYLRTSKQLRLLDLETKSPLYTHFLDTFRGIVTLRAFGYVSDDMTKNAKLLDTSQRPAYLLVMIQEWLNVSLDLLVMVLAAVLTTLTVRLRSSSGFAGASLVTLMGFGENLSGIVIYYTRLETSIGAIARLKNFNETVKPEDREDENVVPLEHWPQGGAIELENVSASYNTNSPQDPMSDLALRDIHLKITPGEKIAICGRTGSGKSSLIALMLKLLDPLPGTQESILIDGMQLYRINRSKLRQHIIAVPQEAVFLPDATSFQTNLDPDDRSTSEECQSVLETVAMWEFVLDRGGLQAGMNPATLSAGQRQLLSLGRAVLRRRLRAKKLDLDSCSSEGGILLLDEINSSVDQETERVMLKTIRKEFESYTVIAVSHRLSLVMDFDRVIVMEKGEIVEAGNPSILASSVTSRFGSLVKAETGSR